PGPSSSPSPTRPRPSIPPRPNPARLGEDRIDACADRLVVADIDDDGLNSSAGRLGRTSARAEHPQSGLGELATDPPADARRRARHDRYPFLGHRQCLHECRQGYRDRATETWLNEADITVVQPAYRNEASRPGRALLRAVRQTSNRSTTPSKT